MTPIDFCATYEWLFLQNCILNTAVYKHVQASLILRNFFLCNFALT